MDARSLIGKGDCAGRLPIHLAAHGGHIAVFEYILQVWDRSIVPGTMALNSNSPLHLAIKSGRVEMSQYLVERYPDWLWAVDDFGCNVLHLALQSNHFREFLEVIVPAVIMHDRNGRLRWLLTHKNNSGFTAESYAVREGQSNIAIILRAMRERASFSLFRYLDLPFHYLHALIEQ